MGRRLKERNLHDDLNSMFTAFWQMLPSAKPGRYAWSKDMFSRFGDEDYAEIKAVTCMARNERLTEELLAYLDRQRIRLMFGAVIAMQTDSASHSELDGL